MTNQIRVNLTPNDWSTHQGEVNHAKRQKPKKFTKAEKQALDILIRNRRKR